MDKYKLRKECSRLFKCETMNDSYELLDIYLNYIFQTINNHNDDPVYSDADRDAKIVNQMMFTKIAHLRIVVEGINYQSENGSRLKNVIDPTIVASFIRNIYETVCMFNLIYINTQSNDEKIILYNLWVHSGLKYRQKFEYVITTKESEQKFLNEQKQIQQLTDEIENTHLYKKLDAKNQKKIQTKLKKKDYKIKFSKKEITFLNWQDMTKVLGIKNDFFDEIYTYFSLYSHPSNVAVFQFSEMFRQDDKPFLRLTNSNLMNCFMLLSIYFADYIIVFPKVLETFKKLSIKEQVVINFYNHTMRGDKYSINNSWKELE